MPSLIFVTGNTGKFTPAATALNAYGITLVQHAIDLPEYQSGRIEEVAAAKAQLAVNQLRQPLIVSDAGYSIPALGGFPGPFIKFINHMITAEDLCAMMARHPDRRVILRECLTYAAPDGTTQTFVSEMTGTLAPQPSPGPAGSGTMIDQLYIPPGDTRTNANIPLAERYALWAKHLPHLHDFARWYTAQPSF